MEEFQNAEEQFLEALRIEPNHVGFMAGSVSVYLHIKDDERTAEYLEMLGNSSELPLTYFREGVEACLEAGLTHTAQLAFSLAVRYGASPAWQQNLTARYPMPNQ